jgi:N-acetylglucosamine-6-phosphate deacetylase
MLTARRNGALLVTLAPEIVPRGSLSVSSIWLGKLLPGYRADLVAFNPNDQIVNQFDIFGTTGLLPTLISDTSEKMRVALHTASAVYGQEPSVLGIHLEGPYLSIEPI